MATLHENVIVAGGMLDLSDTETKLALTAVVGVLVHNEEPSVETCLRAILAEEDGHVKVRSVVVVSSGCTDGTEEIAARIATEDPRVRLIVEKKRSGKAAAINLLMRETSEDIVVVLGGDVVFTRRSLLNLLAPFNDPTVGMTGARPVPTNPRAGILNRTVNVLWDLHHQVSLEQPKMGEAVAFRRVVEAIDAGTLVDEATMEHVILSRGLRLLYVPLATVRNRGPQTFREYLRQRTRVFEGHLALASSSGYRVATMDLGCSIRAAWRLWRRGENTHYLVLAAGLEAIARTRARFSRFSRPHEHSGIWKPIQSSKQVVAKGHVLRAHHEGQHELRYRYGSAPGVLGRKTKRKVGSQIKRLIRVDDRVRMDSGYVTVTLRCDDLGAQAVSARLREALTDLVPSRVLPATDGVPQAEATPV